MEQMRDTKYPQIGLIACTVVSQLRTRVANSPSISPVSAKVAIFRNIVALSMY